MPWFWGRHRHWTQLQRVWECSRCRSAFGFLLCAMRILNPLPDHSSISSATQLSRVCTKLSLVWKGSSSGLGPDGHVASRCLGTSSALLLVPWHSWCWCSGALALLEGSCSRAPLTGFWASAMLCSSFLRSSQNVFSFLLRFSSQTRSNEQMYHLEDLCLVKWRKVLSLDIWLSEIEASYESCNCVSPLQTACFVATLRIHTFLLFSLYPAIQISIQPYKCMSSLTNVCPAVQMQYIRFDVCLD